MIGLWLFCDRLWSVVISFVIVFWWSVCDQFCDQFCDCFVIAFVIVITGLVVSRSHVTPNKTVHDWNLLIRDLHGMQSLGQACLFWQGLTLLAIVLFLKSGNFPLDPCKNLHKGTCNERVPEIPTWKKRGVSIKYVSSIWYYRFLYLMFKIIIYEHLLARCKLK